jgi:hypothetical protein
MAVDFSTRATDLNENIVPASAIVQPVTHEGEIDALKNIGRGLGVGLRTVGQFFENQDNIKKNKALGNFTLSFQNIVDAVDQGSMTPAEGRIRQRHLLQQAISDDPNRQEDYLQLYSANLNNSGYDKVQTPALQKMEMDQRVISSAVDNGFLAAADINNPEKVQKAIENQQDYQQVVRQLELDNKKIDQKLSTLNLSAKEREELNNQKQETAMTGLHKVAAASLPYWRTQYEDIKNQMAQAGSEQERQQIAKNGIVKLDQDFQQQLMTITGGTLDLNDAKIQQVVSPIKSLIDTYKKELSGEYDTEMFKKYSDNAQAQAEMSVWDGLDPKARQMITMSKLFGDNAVVLNKELSVVAANFFSKQDASITGTGKPVDLMQPKEEQRDINKYLDSLTTLMDRASKKEMGDEAVQQLDTQINATFKSIATYGGASTDAQEFQPLVDFLSNPKVGQYLVKSGAKVPPEFSAKAQEIIRDGYQQQVVPLLKDELARTVSEQNKSNFGDLGFTNRSYTVSDILEPTSINGRFSFKLKDGVEVNTATSNLLRTENNSAFTKVMNKLIMLNAHMSGNTDYQKSYDALVPQVFDGSTVKVDTKDQSLNDFVEAPQQYSANDGTPDKNANYIEYANKGAIRDKPLSDKLVKSMSFLGDMGITARVFSGGQDATGSKRTGSHRHDEGNAADVFFYKDGRRLDWADPEDRKIFQEIVRKGKQAGLTGFGAGPGYMRQGSMHIGFGSPAVWGAGGHGDNAPAWLLQAYNG